MEFNDIKTFVAQKGFRTLTEIKENFSKEDQEVLKSHLDYLTSKNSLKKVKYTDPSGVSELYCIPV
jgi:hypothetical protein